MGKKRRVWWIVGSLVVAVALFAGLAFVVEFNSTDARIERAVARIVEEYGFVLQDQSALWSDSGPTDSGTREGTASIFKRAPISAKTASEIVAILSQACPSCKYVNTVYGEDHLPVRSSDPWYEAHNFLAEEPDGSWTIRISLITDDNGFGFPEYEPQADLTLINIDEPGPWQRIKGLWPW